VIKVDTEGWKEFKLKELFYKCDLKKKKDFNKAYDISTEKNEEFDLPLVNAKHGNNGIMYYGRSSEWGSEEKTIDIVNDGAASTGDVYAQIGKTGILYNAYLIKPFYESITESQLLFLASIIEKHIKKHFGYENKAGWEKVKQEGVLLPATPSDEPDWQYMEDYMTNMTVRAEKRLEELRERERVPKHQVDITEWKEFKVGELFNIVNPKVYHKHDVEACEGGIPYVTRSKFNNGITNYVYHDDKFVINPKGVVSFGSENASFFYQTEEYISGRDMYYIDTRELSQETCMFLISCFSSIVNNYSYNFGLFPKLLREEIIKLPVTSDGSPDWRYMEDYMKDIMSKAEERLNIIK